MARAERSESELLFARALFGLRAELGALRAAFDPKRAFSDRRVHEVRKASKRARACLRLLRPLLGERAYAQSNARLRDVARPLAAARDASVLLATADRLMAEDERCARALHRFRRVLSHEHLELSKRLRRSARALPAVHSLGRLEAEVHACKPRAAAEHDFERSIRKIYKRGRRSLAALERNASDTRLHELRKQAKYLGNVLQVFASEAPQLKQPVARARKLAAALGVDHDLAELKRKASKERPAFERKALRTLERGIDRRRARLEQRALKQAARLYAKTPKAFTRELMETLAR